MLKKYSGKFVLRVKPAEHAQLALEAQKQGSSLNKICVERLRGKTAQLSPKNYYVKKLQDHFGDLLEGVVLFGSVARGEQHKQSDTDLLIILHPSIKIDRSTYKTWNKMFPPQDTASPHFVSLPMYCEKAGSIWLEVAIEGILLWEKDFKVSHFTRDLRKYILDGNVTRASTQGQPYWIRKQNAK